MNKKRKITTAWIVVILIAALLLSYFIAWFFISLFASSFESVFYSEVAFSGEVLGFAAALFVICILALLLVLFKYKMLGFNKMLTKNTKLDSNLYGSSDWQTREELDGNYKPLNWKDIAITSDAQGLIVSSRIDKKGQFIVNRANGRHAMVIATTRTGKTKFFIEPNLQYLANCSNKPSLFISDPKGELYADNSDNLKRNGYNIFVFNLLRPNKSHRYNPLSIVWDFYHKYRETEDTQYLDEAEAILKDVAATVAPTQHGGDNTWDLGAQNIIQGICLGMLEDSEDPKFGMTKDKFTLWNVLNILQQGKEPLKDFGLRRKKNGLAKARLAQYVDNDAKETLGSFIVSTTNHLQKYTDSGMTALMSETELKLDEIADKPYAIFCIVPDDNKARHPLAALFVSQIYKTLIHISNEQADKHGGEQKLPNEFYFILEEFGNFPKMECIEQMLSIGGGRRIWTTIVLQSLSQIRQIYGKETAETILNNCQLQIYMGTTEKDTNEYYSALFGSKTVNKRSLQISSADLSKDLSGTTGAEKAVLIQPDELSRLQMGEIVFKVFRHQPVRTHLLPIFDPELKQRGVWNIGAHQIHWETKTLNKDKLYYDLLERDNAYDNIDTTEEMESLEELELKEDGGEGTPAATDQHKKEEKPFDYLAALKKKAKRGGE